MNTDELIRYRLRATVCGIVSQQEINGIVLTFDDDMVGFVGASDLFDDRGNLLDRTRWPPIGRRMDAVVTSVSLYQGAVGNVGLSTHPDLISGAGWPPGPRDRPDRRRPT